MAKNSVRVEGHDGKYYELTKFEAMDMLCHCQAKAACLAAIAPEITRNQYDANSPEVNGLAFIMGELADDLKAVTDVLWGNYQGEERDAGRKPIFKDHANPAQPPA